MMQFSQHLEHLLNNTPAHIVTNHFNNLVPQDKQAYDWLKKYKDKLTFHSPSGHSVVWNKIIYGDIISKPTIIEDKSNLSTRYYVGNLGLQPCDNWRSPKVMLRLSPVYNTLPEAQRAWLDLTRDPDKALAEKTSSSRSQDATHDSTEATVSITVEISKAPDNLQLMLDQLSEENKIRFAKSVLETALGNQPNTVHTLRTLLYPLRDKLLGEEEFTQLTLQPVHQIPEFLDHVLDDDQPGTRNWEIRETIAEMLKDKWPDVAAKIWNSARITGK